MYRYEKIRNRSLKYRFSTGTDEHGTKVQQAAALHKQAPNDYCDQISQKYRQLFDAADIQYTHFNRTTDKVKHLKAAQHFWVCFFPLNPYKTFINLTENLLLFLSFSIKTTLADKDYIYKSKYSGWYSVSDETFLTEHQIKDNEKKEKVSLESGHPVKWVEEENYMFKLSEFQEAVKYWVSNR